MGILIIGRKRGMYRRALARAAMASGHTDWTVTRGDC